MLRFIARHGLVRMIGGRAVPALLLWDLAMLANRTRRIPVVDRGVRRGADMAVRGVRSVASSRPTVGRSPGPRGNRRSSPPPDYRP
jgi:hypothetical protein